MMGLIIKEAMVRATPVSMIVVVPFEKYIPIITREIRYSVIELIKKYFIARLIMIIKYKPLFTSFKKRFRKKFVVISLGKSVSFVSNSLY